jgi:F-type H+-transporting ATPase subunit alpha
MVEVLKQPQYRPYSVTDEVLAIFAGTQGLLDDLPVPQVARFEEAMIRHFQDAFPEVRDELAQKGEISDELAEKIKKVIAEFKAQWKLAQAQPGSPAAASAR